MNQRHTHCSVSSVPARSRQKKQQTARTRSHNTQNTQHNTTHTTQTARTPLLHAPTQHNANATYVHVVSADDVESARDLLERGVGRVDALVAVAHHQVDRLVKALQHAHDVATVVGDHADNLCVRGRAGVREVCGRVCCVCARAQAGTQMRCGAVEEGRCGGSAVQGSCACLCKSRVIQRKHFEDHLNFKTDNRNRKLRIDRRSWRNWAATPTQSTKPQPHERTINVFVELVGHFFGLLWRSLALSAPLNET